MVNSFNYGYKLGELSATQKQAIVTLIDKGKDRSLLENWRPISLPNVDDKIVSKVLTCRLHDKILKLVDVNQTGFVKARYVNDSIRTIYDIIQYCQITNTNAMLMLIEAFDSLNWKLMFTTMEKNELWAFFYHMDWIML